MFKPILFAAVFACVIGSGRTAHAWADYRYPNPHYHRPYVHVYNRYPAREWHRGYWRHSWHDGHLGWWWVVGGAWHFFPRYYNDVPPQTVIIEQQPAPVTVVQPVPAQPAPVAVAPAPAPETIVRYYCKATGTFYPDTMTCPGGWATAIGGTPPSP